MLRISLILILTSVSIDCENWCPYIKPNDTYKSLRMYYRFRNDEGEADFVMYNRAGAEWLFNVTHNGSDKYDIHLLYNTVKHTVDEAVLHRFGVLTKIKKRVWPVIVYSDWDCTVSSLQNRVKFV